MAWTAKILIVEDDRATGLLYFNLLRDTYDVTLAATGADALTYLNEKAPDMILLDQLLPDMEGIEITRYVRANQRFAGTKIVMISGHSSTEQRLVAYRAGVDDFLGKPVDTSELLERVETDLAMRRSRRADLVPEDMGPAPGQSARTPPKTTGAARPGNYRPNCWEFMQCGQDKTGGDCPAFVQQVGRYCWLVAGTMCAGKVTGIFAMKMVSCMDCRFYQSIRKNKQT